MLTKRSNLIQISLEILSRRQSAIHFSVTDENWIFRELNFVYLLDQIRNKKYIEPRAFDASLSSARVDIEHCTTAVTTANSRGRLRVKVNKRANQSPNVKRQGVGAAKCSNASLCHKMLRRTDGNAFFTSTKAAKIRPPPFCVHPVLVRSIIA